MRSCGGCKYWANQSVMPNGQTLAECRRFPPHVVVIPVNGQLQFASQPSQTLRNFWCGEWSMLTVNENEKDQ
jgi:hypothetical protein